MDSIALPKTKQDVGKYAGYKLWVIIGGILAAFVMLPANWVTWLLFGFIAVTTVWVISYVNINKMKQAMGSPSKEQWKSFLASLPENDKALDAQRQDRERRAAAAARKAEEAKNAETLRLLMALPQFELKPEGSFANVEVVGESFREQNVIKALDGLPLGHEKQLHLSAHLVPEENNPHDSNAIMIWMNDQHVGYLSREDAADYRNAIEKIFNGGYLPTTAGRLWGATRSDPSSETGLRHHLYARVALDHHSLIRLPTNNPPFAAYSMLPWGSAIQVTKESDFLPELTEHLRAAESYAIATLHKETRTLKNGTARDYLVVKIDGDQVGELTPATSAKMLPVVAHLADMDLETAVWAKVKGTPLAIEVTLHAAKAHEIGIEWFDSLPHTAPVLYPRSHIPSMETIEPLDVRKREEKWEF